MQAFPLQAAPAAPAASEAAAMSTLNRRWNPEFVFGISLTAPTCAASISVDGTEKCGRRLSCTAAVALADHIDRLGDWQMCDAPFKLLIRMAARASMCWEHEDQFCDVADFWTRELNTLVSFEHWITEKLETYREVGGDMEHAVSVGDPEFEGIDLAMPGWTAETQARLLAAIVDEDGESSGRDEEPADVDGEIENAPEALSEHEDDEKRNERRETEEALHARIRELESELEELKLKENQHAGDDTQESLLQHTKNIVDMVSIVHEMTRGVVNMMLKGDWTKMAQANMQAQSRSDGLEEPGVLVQYKDCVPDVNRDEECREHDSQRADKINDMLAQPPDEAPLPEQTTEGTQIDTSSDDLNDVETESEWVEVKGYNWE